MPSQVTFEFDHDRKFGFSALTVAALDLDLLGLTVNAGAGNDRLQLTNGYDRVGPDIHGNAVWDDTDIVHFTVDSRPEIGITPTFGSDLFF